MSLTLDMSKFNCVIAGRRLKNISEFQRSDDGEKGTVSDPDIYGNVVYTKKKNKMAEFEVTVLNRTDDHDLLEKYYQEDREFTFSYVDKRKIGVSIGGSSNQCAIIKAAGQGLEDDPTYTITCFDYQAK